VSKFKKLEIAAAEKNLAVNVVIVREAILGAP